MTAPIARTGRKRPPTISKKRAPTRSVERELWDLGHDVVVGIDEVGRGAWAGPLMVGAVILPRDRRVNGVRDSKLLTERDRERLFERIATWTVAWGVGAATQIECDELGMSAAQRLAAARALAGLGVTPDAAVVDGRWDFVSPHVAHVERRVKADARCLSVAAASILAKVVRDREMREHAEHYPRVVLRHQQGLPVPGAQGRPAGLRAVGDPPPQLGLHGPLRPVARHPPRPTAPTNPRSSDHVFIQISVPALTPESVSTGVKRGGEGSRGTARTAGGPARRWRAAVAPGPTRIEQPSSAMAVKTSSSVRSSPTKAMWRAPNSPLQLGHRLGLARRPGEQLDDAVARLDVGAGHVGRSLSQQLGRPGADLGVRLADVEDDAGRLELDPRPVAGEDGGGIGQGGQPVEAPALVGAQLDLPLVAPLQPVQPEHLHDVREPEPGEVLDRAARHDGHRRAVGQARRRPRAPRAAARRRRRGRRSAPAPRRRRDRPAAGVPSAAAAPATASGSSKVVPSSRGDPLDGVTVSLIVTRPRRCGEVGEEPFGPSLHVAAAHDLAQPGHAGPAARGGASRPP